MALKNILTNPIFIEKLKTAALDRVSMVYSNLEIDDAIAMVQFARSYERIYC